MTKLRILLAVLIPIILASCSVPLRPFDKEGLLKESKKDIQLAQADVEPIADVLDLNEAIARGLKYNLDFKVRQLEQALAVDQNAVAAIDMLPKVVGSAGYYGRSNDAINRSSGSASTFISTDRGIGTLDLGLSWNVLDFGASYFNARQQGDRVLIALERRRKAMHNLVQDIRTAYLRAYVAQSLEIVVLGTIQESEAVLINAKQAEHEKLRSPADILKIQKSILDNLRVLESIKQELSTARYELTSLINVRPGSDFKLGKPPANIMSPSQLSISVDEMEDMAISNNADLREQLYTARIAKDDIKKNMLRMFPGISFNMGPHYSSNSYLENSQWNDAAVQVSWNLLNVLSIPSQISSGKNASKLYEKKKISVVMGLITQVHIARMLYDNSYQALKRDESILDVDKRLNEISQQKVDAHVESKLEHVTYRTAYILSLLRKFQALSQLYAAEGKLRSTLGQEIIAGDVSNVPLNELSLQVGAAMIDWLPNEVAQKNKQKPQ
jgi:outer membrane protein TolC